MGAKKLCTICGHPTTNYHFYRNGAWYCKTTSLQSPGPNHDKAAVAAALASGKAPVSAGTPNSGGQSSSSSSSTPKTKVQAAPAQTFPEGSLKAKISKWLKDHDVENYVINDDDTVSVNGDIELINLQYKRLPVTFKEITGNVTIVASRLETLAGLPQTINGDLEMNKVKVLDWTGCPAIVKGSVHLESSIVNGFGGDALREVGKGVYLDYSVIESLKGFPPLVRGALSLRSSSVKSLEGLENTHVMGNFSLQEVKNVTNLRGIPKRIEGDLILTKMEMLKTFDGIGEVGGKIDAAGLGIVSLVGLPQTINGSLSINSCPKLTSIEGIPSTIKGDLTLDCDHIATLGHIHKHLKYIGGTFIIASATKWNSTTYTYDLKLSRVLGLAMIRGLKRVDFARGSGSNSPARTAEAIINLVIAGDIDIHEAQEQLIDAGFGNMARL